MKNDQLDRIEYLLHEKKIKDQYNFNLVGEINFWVCLIITALFMGIVIYYLTGSTSLMYASKLVTKLGLIYLIFICVYQFIPVYLERKKIKMIRDKFLTKNDKL
jgi:uncharacterized membrane protein (DUF373 family)